MIQIKRVYEDYDKADGYRILIDRLWPRGVSKKEAHIDLWLKEIAPTTKLRQWFGHETLKWHEFQKRYEKELNKNADLVSQIKDLERNYKRLTLVYSAKDLLHNDAVALSDYLKGRS